MPYDLRLTKLTSGEMVIGKYDAANNCLNDVAALQTVPTQQGVQMVMLPYGYPFEQDFNGKISMTHVLYTYANCPEELQTRYLEACSNLTLSTGGLGGVNLKNPGGGKTPDLTTLIRGK